MDAVIATVLLAVRCFYMHSLMFLICGLSENNIDMKHIRILHLSDLHCDNSPDWSVISKQVLNGLMEISPQVVVVSGDLVERPNYENFKRVESFIDSIIKSSNGGVSPKVLIVPGNHDYYSFGCKIPFISKKSGRYHDFEGVVYRRQGGKNELLKEIAEKYNIAFFLLDSNLGNKSGALAQGEVSGGHAEFDELARNYKKIAADSGREYEDMLKIAILHHHPLPLAVKYKKEDYESFLLLNNAYNLLDACKDSDVNMIMHGHKHTSNFFGLKIYDKVTDLIGSTMISSCSTTSKVGADEHEMILVEVSSACAMHAHRYIASSNDSSFKKGNRFELRYYGDIRKGKKQRLSDKSNTVVKNVVNKTKIISIDEDGTAYITVTLSGIKWRESSALEERYLIERIRSDLGRVPGGFYDFQSSLFGREESMAKWFNTSIENGIVKNPESPEAYEKIFKPFTFISEGETDCFKMDYYISGGYALSYIDHKNKYKNWPADRRLQEIATISVNYPIDSLELIVSFPQELFPSGATFKVEAYKKEDLDQKSGLRMLYGRLPIENEETAFLIKKTALRVRPENNEVSAIIKYPRTDLEYVIRWDLPERDYRAIPNYEFQEVSNNLFCKKVLNPVNRPWVNNFYSEVSAYVMDELFKDSKYNVFMLAYEPDEKKLKVIGTPHEYIDKVCGDIIVGRGPAGKAFLNRGVIFWSNKPITYRKHMFPVYPVEEIIIGLKPRKVFAIPLIHTPLITEDGNLSTSGQLDEEYLYPAWGCLSVTSSEEESFAGFYGDEAMVGRQLIEKYMLINRFVKCAVQKKL